MYYKTRVLAILYRNMENLSKNIEKMNLKIV
jgi:hypothetical protein